MATFTVNYICTFGRSYEREERTLVVEIEDFFWDKNPAKFFIAIKELMRLQNQEHCTGQFFTVNLCPVYKVTEQYDAHEILINYHKFSKKFMDSIELLGEHMDPH